MQLAEGWDWFGDAWTDDLSAMADDVLVATVEDMAQCWLAHSAEVIAHAAPKQPWFARYADNPQRLVDEARAYRQHKKRFPHGASCRCESCRAITGDCSPHCRFCHPQHVQPAGA